MTLQWQKTTKTQHRKLKTKQHKHNQKSVVISGAPEGQAYSVPLVAPSCCSVEYKPVEKFNSVRHIRGKEVGVCV